MRIAYYSRDPAWLTDVREHLKKIEKRGGGLEEDYFQQEDEFYQALEASCYDFITVYACSRDLASEELVRRLKTVEGKSLVFFACSRKRGPKGFAGSKYAARFNGQDIVMDLEDIYFLESYNRKTSIVRERDKIRINARLNVEEQKFPGCQFVRINQGSIVNLQYIHSLEGDKICMKNDEVLYISSTKRKAFLKRYQDYLLNNCHLFKAEQ